MKKFVVLLVAAVAFTAFAPVRAAAQSIEPGVALEVDPLIGQHGINRPGEKALFGLYFIEPEARYGRLTLRAEYLPTTSQFPGLNTDLKIFVPEARYAVGDRALAGLGWTQYNQKTVFDAETERSNMIGLRVLGGAQLDRQGSFVTIAATPRMHGHVHDECIGSVVSNSFGCVLALRRSTGEADEVGSQVDAEARWYFRSRWRHGRFFAGFRYVNFIAQITYRDHRDVDHNQGAGLQLGYRVGGFER